MDYIDPCWSVKKAVFKLFDKYMLSIPSIQFWTLPTILTYRISKISSDLSGNPKNKIRSEVANETDLEVTL